MGLLGNNYGIGLLVSGKDVASPAFASASKSVASLARQHGVSVKQMEKQIDGLAKSYDKSQKRMRTSFKVAGLGAAMLLPSIKLFKTAAGFEQSMTNVRAITRATADEYDMLVAKARELGATTKWTASQAAAGQKFLGMAGFSAQQIVDALPGVLDLGTATGMEDLGRVSDISSDILSGFGLLPAEMGRVADVLVATTTTANTNLELLGDTMKYVGPIARQAGLDFEEAAAMAGLLGNVGIKGTQAGTTLRAALLRLAAPTSESRRKFEELGISIEDSLGNVRKPLEILGDLAKATEKMGSAERIGTFKMMFEAEAATGMSELIGKEGAGAITKYADMLRGAEGTAARTAGTMADTAEGDLKKFASAQEALQISMGTQLIPTVRLATTVLTGYTGAIDKLATSHPNLSKALSVGIPISLMAGGTLLGVAFKIKMLMTQMALLKLMGGAGETTGLVGMFARMRRSAFRFGNTTVMLRTRMLAMAGASRIAGLATGGAAGLWGMTKRAVLGLRALSLASVAASLKLGIAAVATKLVTIATWLFSAALWANPITWIIGGVIALGVGLYFLVTRWDAVSDAIVGAWGWMTTMIKDTPTWLLAIIFPLGLIIKYWDEIKTGIGSAWGLLKGFGRFFVNLWDKFGWVVKYSPVGLAITGWIESIKWLLDALGLLDGGTEKRGGVLADRETGGPAITPGGNLEPATLSSGAVIYRPADIGAGTPEVSTDDIWDLKNAAEPEAGDAPAGATTVINHNKFDLSGTKLNERQLARKVVKEQHDVERRGAAGVRR